MKERPILFSAPMVRAILDGSKTQTRRVVKGDVTAERMESFFTTFGANGYMFFGPEHEATFPSREAFHDWAKKVYPEHQWTLCPYGKPGDRLWVRETWAHDASSVEQCRVAHEDAMGSSCGPYFRATECAPETLRWIPSIHMPRWASRITLEITAVRVERLQDISRGDCMAEGCPFPNIANETDPKKWYADLWRSINGDDAWDKNPWVWVVEFKQVKP